MHLLRIAASPVGVDVSGETPETARETPIVFGIRDAGVAVANAGRFRVEGGTLARQEQAWNRAYLSTGYALRCHSDKSTPNTMLDFFDFRPFQGGQFTGKTVFQFL